MQKHNYLKFMGFRRWVYEGNADQTLQLATTAGSVNTGAANFGNFALLGTDGTDLRITVQAAAAAGVRGAAYSALTDVVTGELFGDRDGAGTAAAGETTLLLPGGYAVGASNGIVTVEASDGTGGDGYDFANNDVVTVTAAYDPTHGGSGQMENAAVYPTKNFLGADAISATSTLLSFKSVLGTQVDDTIEILHAPGKFKDVCKMMEAACSGFINQPSGQLLTVTDVNAGLPLPLIDSFDLGITGCTINFAA